MSDTIDCNLLTGRLRTRRVAVFSLSARMESLELYARAILEVLPTQFQSDEVLFGLVEAISNAILHGALGLDSTMREQGCVEEFLDCIERAERELSPFSRIWVTVELDAKGVLLRVRDPGPGFDTASTPVRERRGLSIIRTVFSSAEWNEKGNEQRLRLDTRDRGVGR